MCFLVVYYESIKRELRNLHAFFVFHLFFTRRIVCTDYNRDLKVFPTQDLLHDFDF